MIVSKTFDLTTSAVPLTPPGGATTDRRPGYSVLVSNVLSVDIKVGGSNAQTFTVKAGAALPMNDLEPGEIVYAKLGTGTGTIEALFQGVAGTS